MAAVGACCLAAFFSLKDSVLEMLSGPATVRQMANGGSADSAQPVVLTAASFAEQSFYTDRGQPIKSLAEVSSDMTVMAVSNK